MNLKADEMSILLPDGTIFDFGRREGRMNFNASIGAIELRIARIGTNKGRVLPDLSGASPLCVSVMGEIGWLIHFEAVTTIPIEVINDTICELTILRSARIEPAA